jgi:PBP1b-binding outer membrane lipoprotein LpoB
MQRKRISILILFLALFTADCSRTDTTRVAFKTPEEAITYYLDGVAQNDIRKILQACAINEIGGNFKFDLYAERLGAWNPTENLSPTDYPFYSEINKTYLSSQILKQVKNLSYSLLSNEKLDGSTFKADAERVNRFIKDIDPQRLSKLEIKKISLSNKTVMNEARYQENSAKIARSFGADELTERLVLFSFEQNYYYVGFTLLRYGANWKISDQVSGIGNTFSNGAAQKTTEEKFESVINSH